MSEPKNIKRNKTRPKAERFAYVQSMQGNSKANKIEMELKKLADWNNINYRA